MIEIDGLFRGSTGEQLKEWCNKVLPVGALGLTERREPQAQPWKADLTFRIRSLEAKT